MKIIVNCVHTHTCRPLEPLLLEIRLLVGTVPRYQGWQCLVLPPAQCTAEVPWNPCHTQLAATPPADSCSVSPMARPRTRRSYYNSTWDIIINVAQISIYLFSTLSHHLGLPCSPAQMPTPPLVAVSAHLPTGPKES